MGTVMSTGGTPGVMTGLAGGWHTLVRTWRLQTPAADDPAIVAAQCIQSTPSLLMWHTFSIFPILLLKTSPAAAVLHLSAMAALGGALALRSPAVDWERAYMRTLAPCGLLLLAAAGPPALLISVETHAIVQWLRHAIPCHSQVVPPPRSRAAPVFLLHRAALVLLTGLLPDPAYWALFVGVFVLHRTSSPTAAALRRLLLICGSDCQADRVISARRAFREGPPGEAAAVAAEAVATADGDGPRDMLHLLLRDYEELFPRWRLECARGRGWADLEARHLALGPVDHRWQAAPPSPFRTVLRAILVGKEQERRSVPAAADTALLRMALAGRDAHITYEVFALAAAHPAAVPLLPALLTHRTLHLQDSEGWHSMVGHAAAAVATHPQRGLRERREALDALLGAAQACGGAHRWHGVPQELLLEGGKHQIHIYPLLDHRPDHDRRSACILEADLLRLILRRLQGDGLQSFILFWPMIVFRQLADEEGAAAERTIAFRRLLPEALREILAAFRCRHPSTLAPLTLDQLLELSPDTACTHTLLVGLPHPSVEHYRYVQALQCPGAEEFYGGVGRNGCGGMRALVELVRAVRLTRPSPGEAPARLLSGLFPGGSASRAVQHYLSWESILHNRLLRRLPADVVRELVWPLLF